MTLILAAHLLELSAGSGSTGLQTPEYLTSVSYMKLKGDIRTSDTPAEERRMATKLSGSKGKGKVLLCCDNRSQADE
jgi:hypothetical protein